MQYFQHSTTPPLRGQPKCCRYRPKQRLVHGRCCLCSPHRQHTRCWRRNSLCTRRHFQHLTTLALPGQPRRCRYRPRQRLVHGRCRLCSPHRQRTRCWRRNSPISRMHYFQHSTTPPVRGQPKRCRCRPKQRLVHGRCRLCSPHRQHTRCWRRNSPSSRMHNFQHSTTPPLRGQPKRCRCRPKQRLGSSRCHL